MKRTLVVWRRLGKEHGEGQGFRVNPSDVVSAHIQRKVTAFRETPDDTWRWWQVTDELIVERPFAAPGFGPESLIYYLPQQNWAFVEHACFAGLGPEWPWYVHIGSTCWDQKHGCWVFTDLFCDVIVGQDLSTHSVLDLNDLARACDIGLVSGAQLTAALDSTQELVDRIRAGQFPPPELGQGRQLAGELRLGEL